MEDEFRHPGDSASVSLSSISSPAHSNIPNDSTINTNHSIQNNNNKIERSSKISDASTSERFNTQLSSFSRCATPSPVANSGQITPVNSNYPEYVSANFIVNQRKQQQADCNRLTIEYMPSTMVIKPIKTQVVELPSSTSTFTSASKPNTNAQKTNNVQPSNGTPSISSQQDDSQYASMLVELEQSLIDKRIQATNMSPDDTSTASTGKFGSSKSSSKDLEFSKELEAALQLIQDLETPSEGPGEGTGDVAQIPTSNTKLPRSESEKTLSAAVSLPSPEQLPYTTDVTATTPTTQNGKNKKQKNGLNIHIESNSQSTSGYSSPNSFTSNAQLSHTIDNITNGNSSNNNETNVVRIYIERNDVDEYLKQNKRNSFIGSATTCKSNANLLTKGHILNASNLINTVNRDSETIDPLNRSFLLFKKRSKKLMPYSDFQSRILQSESLAYLTDEELVARHKCNRDVIRVRILLLNFKNQQKYIQFMELLTVFCSCFFGKY